MKSTPYTSVFEKFVFSIARGFVIALAAIIIAALIVLSVAYISTIKTSKIRVSYEEVIDKMRAENDAPMAPGSIDANVRPAVVIPAAVQAEFSDESNARVLKDWLASILSEDDKKEFLANLDDIIITAQKHGASEAAVTADINAFRHLWLSKENPYSKYEKIGYQAAFLLTGFCLLLILTMLSVILVLLAVERNTRIQSRVAAAPETTEGDHIV